MGLKRACVEQSPVAMSNANTDEGLEKQIGWAYYRVYMAVKDYVPRIDGVPHWVVVLVALALLFMLVIFVIDRLYNYFSSDPVPAPAPAPAPPVRVQWHNDSRRVPSPRRSPVEPGYLDRRSTRDDVAASEVKFMKV